MGSSSTSAHFVVHWLNNKELHFTHEAEHLLEEISQATAGEDVEEDGEESAISGDTEQEEDGSGGGADTGGDSGTEMTDMKGGHSLNKNMIY